MDALLGKPPRMTRDVWCAPAAGDGGLRPRPRSRLKDAAYRVLRLPTVADKTFLITIGDRTVGGLTARDQMVGPWQVPVADVAVTLMGYQGYPVRGLRHGRAHAAGRCSMPRPPAAWPSANR